MTIEKYACPGQFGAIGSQDPGDNWTIEDNEVILNHGAGIVAGSNSVVRNNNVNDNGQIGIKVSRNIKPVRIFDTLIEGNEINRNGKKEVGFNWGWEAGGTKFTKTTNLKVRNNIVRENGGAGLWADIDNDNTLYENNIVEDNYDHGIFHEISYGAKIRNNIVRRNGFGRTWDNFSDKMMHAQIMVSTSKDVDVYNNLVDAGANMNGIIIRYDWRDRKTWSETDEEEPSGNKDPWESKNVSVHNNKIVVPKDNDYGWSGAWVNTDHFKDTTINLDDLNYSFDFDIYQLADLSKNRWIWENGNGNNQLLSFKEFQYVNQELNGRIEDLQTGAQAMYFNDGSGNNTSTLIHPVVFRQESQINFDWSEVNPDIKIGSRNPNSENNFSARYEGTLKVEVEDNYQFQILTEGGVRFWLKDQDFETNLITLDDNSKWEMGDKTVPTNPVTLTAGEYPFRLEYFHHADGSTPAKLCLKWKWGNNDFNYVPETAIGTPLFMNGSGLQGSYYDFIGKLEPGRETIIRIDQQINFNWDKYMPDARMYNDGFFAVVWEGKLKPLYDGTYYLYTSFEGNNQPMSLWFDNEYKIPENEHKYTIENLQAEKLYNIRIEYIKSNKDVPSKGIRLAWESADETKRQCWQLVPPYCLFPPDNPKQLTTGEPEKGLKGMYYNIPSNLINDVDWPGWPDDNSYPDPNLFYPTTSLEIIGDPVVREVSNLNFNWWAGSPDYQIGADYFVSKWVGKITLPQNETQEGYRQFEWTTDDGGILYIDNKKIIDTWTNRSSSNSETFYMKPGKEYDFCAMQFERGGSASTQQVLKWAKLNTNEAASNSKKSNAERCPVVYEVVPPEAFIYPGAVSSETTLSIEDGTGQPGFGASAKINLNNLQDIVGVQFVFRDIPNWLSVNDIKTTTRTEGFEIAVNEDGAGKAIVILYSTTGKIISQGEGQIAELILDVNPDATINETVTLSLENVILSDPAGTSVSATSKDGTFLIMALKGDVNTDGFVDILDVIRTVNIILGVLPEPTETELYLADCNNDNSINVLDIVCIINSFTKSSTEKSGLFVEYISENNLELEHDDLDSGESDDIYVRANFSEEVAGIQMRFSFDSEKLVLGEPTNEEYSSAMSVSTILDDGGLIVLLYSLDGSVINPGEGRILKIPVTFKANNPENSLIKLEEVILADPLAQRIPVSIITGNSILNDFIPENFMLYQNYPNPFSSETFIKYGLPRSANVHIKVYNLIGQEIRELVSEYKEAGFYTVKWDGLDSHNLSVSPGIYIYELNADDNFIGKKKMIVLK